jgi:hypothetical protein
LKWARGLTGRWKRLIRSRREQFADLIAGEAGGKYILYILAESAADRLPRLLMDIH